MPAYNAAPWVEASVRAILDQTYGNFELIISDNASTDDTQVRCEKLAEQDSRIRYVRQRRNIGGPANYNAVFHLARGQYFKWASANDLCAATFLERCAAVLEARPDVVLCYPRTWLLIDGPETQQAYDDGLDLQDDRAAVRFREYLARVRLNNIMNGLIRSSVLRKTPLMQPHLSEDVNLVAELALYGKIAELPERLFSRRMDRASATKLQARDEVYRHYDPDLSTGMPMQTWKFEKALFSAVSRSPLRMMERLRLYGYLCRRLYWASSDIGKELSVCIRRIGRQTA